MAFPSEEWLTLWQNSRYKLVGPEDLDSYFNLPQIAGKDMDLLSLGTVHVPTGAMTARDPFHYLKREDAPYFLRTPTGTFPVTAAVIRPDGVDCARYAAVRVTFSARPAVHYEEALVGIERLDLMGEDEFFGFHVDSGYACICDCAAREAFCSFEEVWREENPGGDLETDYFAPLLQESGRSSPQYQRESGDWINWRIPGTELSFPIFQSGFGPGSYPIYYGFAADGSICQMVIQFIDVELAYGGQLQPYAF